MDANQGCLITKLKRVLSNDESVLFIGSGVSIWSGLPSWWKLLNELADYLDYEGYNSTDVRAQLDKDLLMAASIGINQLNKFEFKNFIRSTCKVDIAKPHIIHNKIINLGPKCYITTNYDQLIEDALKINNGLYGYQVVTNKQPIDCASIIQARAKEFIFKPHGDIDDTESIVLSQEHYRKLYGEQSYTLKTLEILLCTRTVVFIGFGLKDPDFIYIKNKIYNNFKGTNSIHYAIMPDVTSLEKEYWLKEYGINILNYSTYKNKDGSTDHSELLNLLDSLSKGNVEIERHDNIPNDVINYKNNYDYSPEEVLAVVRYCTSVDFILKPRGGIQFPLNVIEYSENNRFEIWSHAQDVNELLMNAEDNMIVIGEPGSGKTHTLKMHCNMVANKVKENYLKYNNTKQEFAISIYIDLKHYNGDLLNMIKKQFSSEFPLLKLSNENKIKLILDSFNEMPRDFIESRSYVSDFSEVFKELNCSAIIGSRFVDGLESFGFKTFKLSEIHYKFVKEYIETRKLGLNSRFSCEIIDLLQKPLFFSLLIEGRINIDQDSTPYSLYTSIFNGLKVRFSEEFAVKFDFIEIFQCIAFGMLDEGKETFAETELILLIDNWLVMNKVKSLSTRDIIIWLIESEQFLVPSPKKKLSFFHQSITEYLASKELAEQFRRSPLVLLKRIRFTRWDQALFLTCSSLDENLSRSFIESILKFDIMLALRASKYIEFGADKITSIILDFLIESEFIKEQESFPGVAFALKNLQVSDIHKNQLRKLINHGNSIGGEAAILLLNCKEASIKDELINLMYSHKDDYNFVSCVGRALSKYIKEDDYRYIVANIKKINSGSIDSISRGFANLLSAHPLENFKDLFYPLEDQNDYLLNTISDIIEIQKDENAIMIGCDLIKTKYYDASFSLYMTLRYDNKEIDLKYFDDDFFDSLEIAVEREENSKYTVDLLEYMCNNFTAIKDKINNRYKSSHGLVKLIYSYCLNSTGEEFKNELIDYINNDKYTKFFIGKFENIEWSKYIVLIITISIKNDDKELLNHALRAIRHTHQDIKINFDTVIEILSWVDKSNIKFRDDYWFIYLLGEFIGKRMDDDAKQKLIEYFNDTSGLCRQFVADYVLGFFNELKLDQFSDESVNYLIKRVRGNNELHRTPIYLLANEEFLEEKLIPYAMKESEPLRKSLFELIERVYKNFGIRYIRPNL